MAGRPSGRRLKQMVYTVSQVRKTEWLIFIFTVLLLLSFIQSRISAQGIAAPSEPNQNNPSQASPEAFVPGYFRYLIKVTIETNHHKTIEHSQDLRSQAWQSTPLIPALGRLRQMDLSLWAWGQPCLGSKFLGKEGETSGGRETADVAVIYLASTRSKVLNSSVYRHRHREGREKEGREVGRETPLCMLWLPWINKETALGQWLSRAKSVGKSEQRLFRESRQSQTERCEPPARTSQ